MGTSSIERGSWAKPSPKAGSGAGLGPEQPQSPQTFVTVRKQSVVNGMGELIEVAGGLQVGVGFVPAILSLLALGLYALFTTGRENNDDDDSSPGGGLMQPVA
jgi:hypothetical protein